MVGIKWAGIEGLRPCPFSSWYIPSLQKSLSMCLQHLIPSESSPFSMGILLTIMAYIPRRYAPRERPPLPLKYPNNDVGKTTPSFSKVNQCCLGTPEHNSAAIKRIRIGNDIPLLPLSHILRAPKEYPWISAKRTYIASALRASEPPSIDFPSFRPDVRLLTTRI